MISMFTLGSDLQEIEVIRSALSEERVSRTMQSLSNHTRGENE